MKLKPTLKFIFYWVAVGVLIAFGWLVFVNWALPALRQVIN